MHYVVLCFGLEHPAKMKEQLSQHDTVSYTAKRQQLVCVCMCVCLCVAHHSLISLSPPTGHSQSGYMKPKRAATRQPCSSGESVERHLQVPSRSQPLNLSQVITFLPILHLGLRDSDS